MSPRFRHPTASVIAAILLVAACGSTATSTSSGSTPPPRAVPSPSPSPTAVPGPTTAIWAVTRHDSTLEIRTASISGTAGTVLASFPPATQPASIMAIGHGKAIVLINSLKTIAIVPLGGGSQRAFAAGSGENFFGGAISPDGNHLAYAAATAGSGYIIRVMDLSNGHLTDVRTSTDNPLDAPSIWNSSTLAGIGLVAFSDAGPQSVFRLDPTTMARTSSTALVGVCSIALAPDGAHTGSAIHAPLGDDADAPAGPGPSRPCNTLQSTTIGSTPVALLSAPHHDIAPLWVSNDGSMLVSNTSAVGGTAGISTSPDFGLFVINGSTRTQLAHESGQPWSAGAMSGSTAIAVQASADGSGAVALQLYHVGAPPSATPATIDSTSDGFVDLIALN